MVGRHGQQRGLEEPGGGTPGASALSDPGPSSAWSIGFHARWGDIDFNGHVANAAYLDIAADCRIQCFEANGFSVREMERLRIGPVVRHDKIEYFRELRLMDRARVSFSAAGLRADGSNFLFRNRFNGEADGQLVARVTSAGGWLDLDRRRLCIPPPRLAALLSSLVREPNFEQLQSIHG